MNCEVAHERIVMAAYAELPDAQVHELEVHLRGCAECLQEREQIEALKLLSAALPVEEPSANLVARSRLRLDEALDTLPPRRWWQQMGTRMRVSLASLQSAPVAASLLLLAGLAAGSVGGYKLALVHASAKVASLTAEPVIAPAAALPATGKVIPAALKQTAQPQAEGPSTVAEISEIVRQPGSNQVEVRFNELVPQRVKGSLNDPAIRQLLMMASEQAPSEGVRNNSVDLMATACRSDHGCNQEGMLEALMVALRYDQNPEVREKALEGLEPFVAEDVRVRNAVLETLLNDSDPGVRTVSINALEPVDADTSVRQVLYTISTSDASPQIRMVSRQVLSHAPEVQ
ncbi:HEAT repeat domain-containing protein [Telmatobacter bradus]|uniref:HEAT repeat domain-containing protein n=1 Tax=Telmatobacter bradus TaxID=474953 RepID=UPI003B4355EA